VPITVKELKKKVGSLMPMYTKSPLTVYHFLPRLLQAIRKVVLSSGGNGIRGGSKLHFRKHITRWVTSILEAALLVFFFEEAYLISGNLCLGRSQFGINK
jgi:hypothetical protein